MGVQEEIMRLKELQQQIEMRIQELMSGGVPMGATPGMGQNVGPDIPPMPPGGGGMPVVAGNGGMPPGGGGMPPGLLPVA